MRKAAAKHKTEVKTWETGRIITDHEKPKRTGNAVRSDLGKKWSVTLVCE